MNKEEIMKSDSELYNDIVEMLSNGNFLQLNGKAINLTELNEYINAQNEEIERLNKRIEDLNIINEEHRILNGMIRKQLKQKENIIKEIRANIEEKVGNEIHDMMYVIDVSDVLDILDKENGDSDESN